MRLSSWTQTRCERVLLESGFNQSTNLTRWKWSKIIVSQRACGMVDPLGSSTNQTVLRSLQGPCRGCLPDTKHQLWLYIYCDELRTLRKPVSCARFHYYARHGPCRERVFCVRPKTRQMLSGAAGRWVYSPKQDTNVLTQSVGKVISGLLRMRRACRSLKSTY